MNQSVKWRVMFFEPSSERLAKVVDLGGFPLAEMQQQVAPNDSQEMCGSYELNESQLAWLATQFKKTDLLNSGFDLFLERES